MLHQENLSFFPWGKKSPSTLFIGLHFFNSSSSTPKFHWGGGEGGDLIKNKNTNKNKQRKNQTKLTESKTKTKSNKNPQRKTEKAKTQKPKQTNKPPNKTKQKCTCSINTSFFKSIFKESFGMTKTGVNACTQCVFYHGLCTTILQQLPSLICIKYCNSKMWAKVNRVKESLSTSSDLHIQAGKVKKNSL